eukprot:jgi/Bigna1/71533/fgenesh1_pg.16_\
MLLCLFALLLQQAAHGSWTEMHQMTLTNLPSAPPRVGVLISAGCSMSTAVGHFLRDYITHAQIDAAWKGEELMDPRKNRFHVRAGGGEESTTAAVKAWIDDFIENNPNTFLAFKMGVSQYFDPDMQQVLKKYNAKAVLHYRANSLDRFTCMVRDCFNCGLKVPLALQRGYKVLVNHSYQGVVKEVKSISKEEQPVLVEYKDNKDQVNLDWITYRAYLPENSSNLQFTGFVGTACKEGQSHSVDEYGKPSKLCFLRRKATAQGLPGNKAWIDTSELQSFIEHVNKSVTNAVEQMNKLGQYSEPVKAEDLLAYEASSSGLQNSLDSWFNVLTRIRMPNIFRKSLQDFMELSVGDHPLASQDHGIYNFDEVEQFMSRVADEKFQSMLRANDEE